MIFFNSLKPQSIKNFNLTMQESECLYHQLLSRLLGAGLAATGEHLRTPASLKRELFLLTTRGRVHLASACEWFCVCPWGGACERVGECEWCVCLHNCAWTCERAL